MFKVTAKPMQSAVQSQTLAVDLQEAVLKEPSLYIRQKKSWLEFFTNFEARNKYELHDSSGRQIGWIHEQGSGFLNFIKRMFLRTHRPFNIEVMDLNGKTLLRFQRKFFFFFSDIEISTDQGSKLGSAHRRFSLFYKRYDLRDPQGNTFATTESGFWRLWTFFILNSAGQPVAKITKKWGGAMRELFTNADAFLIEFDKHPWKAHERAVIFGTAMSIDFDYFERQGGGGVSNLFS